MNLIAGEAIFMNSDQPGLGAPDELESGSPVAEPSHSQAEQNAEDSPADSPSMSGRSVEAIAADDGGCY